MPSDLAARIAERILAEAFRPGSSGDYRLNVDSMKQIINAELAGVREVLVYLDALWSEDGHTPKKSFSKMYFGQRFISNWLIIREIIASLKVPR